MEESPPCLATCAMLFTDSSAAHGDWRIGDSPPNTSPAATRNEIPRTASVPFG